MDFPLSACPSQKKNKPSDFALRDILFPVEVSHLSKKLTEPLLNILTLNIHDMFGNFTLVLGLLTALGMSVADLGRVIGVVGYVEVDENIAGSCEERDLFICEVVEKGFKLGGN